MNKNKQNNRRAIIGITIFAVLIGLNLLVRYSRSSRTATPASPSATALPYPTSSSPAVSPVTIPVPAAGSKSTPDSSTGNGMSIIDKDSLIPGSEQQMLALNSKLETLNQELQAIEKPFEQPDMSIELQMANFDRFRWQTPAIAATATGVITVEPPVATVTKTVEIIGSFKIRGRNKLMVREDQKIFLVNEGEEILPDSIVFEKFASESYLIFDSSGATHDLKLKQPLEDGVEKAVNILKGIKDQQPSFDIRISTPASGTLQLPNLD